MFKVGLVGEYQVGKSTFVNCLLARPVATVGEGPATTHAVVTYLYGEHEHFKYRTKSGKQEHVDSLELKRIDANNDVEEILVYLNNPILKQFSFVDLPGYGFEQRDNKLTEATLSSLDFALVIASNFRAIEGVKSDLLHAVESLKSHNVPYYLILNTVESTNSKWRPTNERNIAIANENHARLSFYPHMSYPFADDELIIVNLMWYWYSMNDTDSLSEELDGILSYYRVTDKEKARKDSNFHLIQKIFNDMDTRLYLELKKDMKDLAAQLKRELIPVGTIQLFSSTELPEGWVPCDGRSLAIAEYEELFNKIGYTYSSEQQSGLFKVASMLKEKKTSTFKIPNLNDKFVRGWNPTESRKLGSCQDDALQGHGHIVNETITSENGEHAHYFRYYTKWVGSNLIDDDKLTRNVYSSSDLGFSTERTYWPIDSNGGHTHTIPKNRALGMIGTGYTDVRVATETRPKNIALLYCIRIK